jgi:pantoate--beta-alanine ligase
LNPRDARQAPRAPEASTPSLVTRIDEVRAQVAEARRKTGGPVGLVPTMGSFHEGHLSLMREARADCRFVAVSIFVNPAQFGPAEDLDKYPRDLEGDLRLAADAGADLVFAPDAGEIYPEGFDTYVEPGAAAEGMCGRSRPGHFRGVATIVAKLFNIFQPDIAYFGQKDAQQAAVVRRLVADLDFALEIRVCPIVREADGLAMSSRNAHLSGEERGQATALYDALVLARDASAAGETDAAKIRRRMRRMMGQYYLVEFEYARIVDPDTMQPVARLDRPALAAVAATVGKTRLIDNMLITPGRTQ